MILSYLSLDVVFVLCVLALALLWRHIRAANTRMGLRLPPGPPGLPVIGNLFDMPTSDDWVVYREWGNKHGS